MKVSSKYKIFCPLCICSAGFAVMCGDRSISCSPCGGLSRLLLVAFGVCDCRTALSQQRTGHRLCAFTCAVSLAWKATCPLSIPWDATISFLNGSNVISPWSLAYFPRQLCAMTECQVQHWRFKDESVTILACKELRHRRRLTIPIQGGVHTHTHTRNIGKCQVQATKKINGVHKHTFYLPDEKALPYVHTNTPS